MKGWLRYLTKKLFYLLVLAFIVIVLARAATYFLEPVLKKHKPDIEQWASQQLNAPVSISRVRLSWYHLQPVVQLRQVAVLDKKTNETKLQIKKIGIAISLTKSLWHRTLVPGAILLAGTDIGLQQDENGDISVQGFPSLGSFNGKPLEGETKFADMITWLSQEERISLRDVSVRYTPKNGPKRFVTLYNLNLENSGNSHLIFGKAILHQETPTEVSVEVEWQGPPTDLATSKAKVYLYVSGLALDQWLAGRSWQQWQVQNGMISAKIWADWNNGALQKIQSKVQIYNLALYSQIDKSAHNINRLSGNIGWRRQGNGQIYAGDDILIDFPTHLWPVSNFYISLQPDAEGVLAPKEINLGYMDLHDVQRLLFASPALLPDSVRDTLKGLQPEGALQDISILFSGVPTDWRHIEAKSSFTRLGVSAWNEFPSAKNLSGKIEWNGNEGTVAFDSEHAAFQYDKIFEEILSIGHLSGDVHWRQNTETSAWVVNTANLKLLNDDLTTNVKGSLTFLPDKSPVADIEGEFTLLNANHVTRYLPMHIFDAGLVEWLHAAFLSGSVQSGRAILKGTLTDFPFDNNNGTFLITGKVKDVEFKFAPDWPELQHVHGNIAFSGRQMIVDVDRAETLGISIGKVHGEIPNFSDVDPQVLTVRAEPIQTNFIEGLRYVHRSPLEQTIGKMFKGVEMNGPTAVTLNLTIPLANPDRTEVRGDLTLTDTTLNLVPWKLIVSKLNGAVQFTETSTTAKNIQGVLFEKPLQFDLTTVQKTKTDSVVRAAFMSRVSVVDLEKWLEVPFSKVIKGETNIQGVIDFSLKAPINIQLRSDLSGLAVNLPDQYGKSVEQIAGFSSDMTIADGQPLRIKLAYNNLLSAALVLDRKKNQFNLLSANVQLGKGMADWPTGDGLYITGDFDELDWKKIKAHLDHSSAATFGKSAGAGLTFAGLPLREININANRLILAGQRLEQVDLQMQPDGAYWNIVINSPAIAGQIRIPANFFAAGVVSAQFQKFSVNSTSGSSDHDLGVKINTIPAINFTANNVSYNGMSFGQVAFNTTPTRSGLTIQSLRISAKHFNMQGSGSWQQTSSSGSTSLQGSATSDNVSGFLSNLGFDVSNFITKKGKLTYDLAWGDAPYAPSLTNLNGNISLDIGQGRIVDIGKDNGAKMDLGRLLSIFSLQTIPRRLSFDFSDVFQKGYSFDTMQGDFKLDNGSAYTSNFTFDGPVAKVAIDGRIGLVNKDFDFTLIVIPYVTSSIPVAVGIVNPIAGVAAFAVNKMIGSEVSKAIAYHYKVQGPWVNPVWESVKVSKR